MALEEMVLLVACRIRPHALDEDDRPSRALPMSRSGTRRTIKKKKKK